MHVLVLPKWYPGRNDPQLGDFIRKQAQALIKLHQVSVLFACPEPGAQQAEVMELDRTNGVWELRSYYRASISPFRPWRKLVNFVRYRRAMRHGLRRLVVEQGAPALIHAHVLTRAVLEAWSFSRTLHIPYLITEHSSVFLDGTWQAKSALAKALDRFLVRKASRVITVSKHLAAAMEQKRLGSSVLVVPNILPLGTETPPASGSADHFLMVTDLVDRIKNISGVLRALHLARAAGHDLRLEVVGDGPDRNTLEGLATSLGLDPYVTWQGRLPNSDALALMAHTGTVIINSNVETFSVVTGEAIALGKPVIATRCGGPEAFITSMNGILIEPGNDRALADAMITMASDHGIFSPAQVRATLGNEFSEEAIADRLDTIYQEVLAHG